MAMAKLACVLLLAVLGISMVATQVMAKEAQYQLDTAYGDGLLSKRECPGQCLMRCSQMMYKQSCLVNCSRCCLRCLCVPPRYNTQVCPCYNNWKTPQGTPKCP